MKFFTNKNIWTKIIIVLIFILLFEFVVAKPSLGADSDGDLVEFGGKLITPFVSLIVTLGDGVVELMHSSIMGTSESLLQADLDSAWYEVIGTIFKVVLYAAATIGVFLMTGGLAGIAAAVVGHYAVTLFGDAVFDNLSSSIGLGSVSSFKKENLPGTLYLPAYSISPEEIFEGKILLFNVDFFNEGKQIKEELDEEGKVKFYYYEDEAGNKVTTSKQDVAQQLRSTISKWYVGLRNIALVCMMIVLLYIGIRILLSTLASDKAKYKQMLQDWFMGILILFLMHYIMAFSVTIVNKLTKIVSSSVEETAYFVDIADDENGKLSDFVEEAGMGDAIQEVEYDGKKEKVIVWPTNLMGSLRLKTQLANWGSEYIGYAICFIALVMFTAFFVFTYLKRVLYMAFLTLMAPLVAVTYPIDKITDGKAQGFDRWFKEYIFNLLIQPMHLLLYYILITSAFELAGKNLIYSLVAIGFMIPAEKLLRSFFGFEKAHTPGVLAGPAGAALTMGAISKLGNLGKGSKASKGESGSGTVGEDSNQSGRKPKFMGDKIDTTEVGATLGQTKTDNDFEEEQKAIDEMRQDANNDDEREYVEQEQQRLDQERLERKMKQKAEKQEFLNNAKVENKPFSQEWLNKKKRRAGRKGKAVLANIATRQINGIKKSPGQAVRFIGKVGMAGGLAAAGISAGIAAGDPSKAFTYATTAGATGYTIGKKLTGKATNAVGGYLTNKNPDLKTKDPKKAYNDIYNGKEYQDLEAEDYLNKFKKENQKQLNLNFSKEQAKEMLQNGGFVDKCVENGVNNIDDIIAAQKMIDNKEVSGYKEAITIAKLSKKVGDDYNDSKKKAYTEEWTKKYNKILGNEKKAEKSSEKSWELVGKFQDGKKSIYK